MTWLVISAEIKADIAEITRQLEEKAGRATAERYVLQFGGAARRLIEMPRCGASRPALGRYTRRLVIRPYILIYDYSPAEDSVTLLRIIHGRRRITAAMLPHA
jgi:toxin ParE1/3/4